MCRALKADVKLSARQKTRVIHRAKSLSCHIHAPNTLNHLDLHRTNNMMIQDNLITNKYTSFTCQYADILTLAPIELRLHVNLD